MNLWIHLSKMINLGFRNIHFVFISGLSPAIISIRWGGFCESQKYVRQLRVRNSTEFVSDVQIVFIVGWSCVGHKLLYFGRRCLGDRFFLSILLYWNRKSFGYSVDEISECSHFCFRKFLFKVSILYPIKFPIMFNFISF